MAASIFSEGRKKLPVSLYEGFPVFAEKPGISTMMIRPASQPVGAAFAAGFPRAGFLCSGSST